jgi:hypothetical protein
MSAPFDIPPAAEMPLSQLREHEVRAYEARCATMRGNPERVFIKKVEALAELLDCDEATAQHILLHRIDVYTR